MPFFTVQAWSTENFAPGFAFIIDVCQEIIMSCVYIGLFCLHEMAMHG